MIRDDVLKLFVNVLRVAFFLSFAFNALVIATGRTWPTVPDAIHTYPLSLKTWGTHYLPTAMGAIFHWSWQISIVLIATIMLIGIVTETRRRRADDSKLKRLMRDGYRGPSPN